MLLGKFTPQLKGSHGRQWVKLSSRQSGFTWFFFKTNTRFTMAASTELGSRVPRKAKQILDRLVGSRAMTQEGMEWLICATDPFHDDRVRCPGYPDLSTVNSVVQTYTTTASFQAPSGQTAPWDFHVPFIPVTPSVIQSPVNVSAPLPSYQSSTQGGIGLTGTQVPLYAGFNAIVSGVVGQDWFTAAAGVGLTNSNILAIPPKFISGHSRLVAAGMEIVNTTASLYKGGSLTVYRAPSAVEDSFLKVPCLIGTAPPTILFFDTPVESVSCPPTTQSEAATYTDSRTWSAEDGAYVVIAQTDIENPFCSIIPRDVQVRKSLDYGTAHTNSTTSTNSTIWSSIVPPITDSDFATGTGCHALPFENCGAILSGLNPNSTLQVTVRYYFERIPATSEPDILAMAQVPPAFDGVALEIYSRCLSAMPVGVPQNENPLGEWFSGILDMVTSVAPKLGNIVSGVGRAISSVGAPTPSSSNATAQRNMTAAQKKQQISSLPKRVTQPSSRSSVPGNTARNRKKKEKKRAKMGKNS